MQDTDALGLNACISATKKGPPGFDNMSEMYYYFRHYEHTGIPGV